MRERERESEKNSQTQQIIEKDRKRNIPTKRKINDLEEKECLL
jgi:hypothetical protein